MRNYYRIIFQFFAVFIIALVCLMPSDTTADENGNAAEIKAMINGLQDSPEEARPAIKTKLIEFGMDADQLLADCQKSTEDLRFLIDLYDMRSAIQLKYLHPNEETLEEFYEKHSKDLALPCEVEVDMFRFSNNDKKLDEFLDALKSSDFDSLVKSHLWSYNLDHYQLKSSDTWLGNYPNMNDKAFSMKPGEISGIITDTRSNSFNNPEKTTYYSIVKCISVKPEKNLTYEELKDKIYSIVVLSHPDVDYAKADYSNPAKPDYSETAIANAKKWLDYDDSHWCGNCAQSRSMTKSENLYKAFCALGDHRRSIRYRIELKYLISGFANVRPLEFYGIDVERLARGSMITVSKPEFNWLSPRASVDICGLFPAPETLKTILHLSETGDEYERDEAIRVLEILAYKEKIKFTEEDETSETVHFEYDGYNRTFRISNFDTGALSDIEPAELSDELRKRIKKVFMDATKDKAPFVRKSAAYALGSILDNDAIPVLKAMLANETSKNVLGAVRESLEIYEEQ